MASKPRTALVFSEGVRHAYGSPVEGRWVRQGLGMQWYKIDAWTRKVGELKEEVKKMLIRAKGLVEEMIMIDEIQRLAVAYHFEKEINDALEHI
ncbi:alpha-humulene synthase-like protein [Cinnamomum micranthum f. kanehirae]|uniref:Alpha-humulene synthase-like protein n=1 Tax=Cinnamomum micranthum f. kanehirae TaxID=337451 RepID=A0A3S3MX41_9MAGN|nr:alpha-humulene synthase-like protein [Cinnamomum micranthum f. kanehirae]